jgi:Predicted membrane protein
MSLTIPILFESFILVFAVCIDSFVASFAYGANKVKIPISSLFIIDFISSSILVIGFLLSSIIRPPIPKNMIDILCFIILFSLGVIKLFDNSLKILIEKIQSDSRNVGFSPKEAISLSMALSLDSIAVGLGAGAVNNHLFIIFILSCMIGFLALFWGNFLGQKIAKKSSLNLSWLNGLLLILLAIMKFF